MTDFKNEELTLVELVSKIKDFFLYVLRFWKQLVSVVSLFAIIGFMYAHFTKKILYKGKMSFVLEDVRAVGSNSPIASLLSSQMNMDVGGVSNGFVSAGDNILSILSSNVIIKRAFAQPYCYDSSKSIGQVFFEVSGLDKEWQKKYPDRLLPVFKIGETKYDLIKDSIFSKMYNIVSANLMPTRMNKKSTMVDISFKSESPYLTKCLLEQISFESGQLYVTIKTKRLQNTVTKLEHRVDSLLSKMNGRSYEAALIKDLNPNPVRQMATVGLEATMREKSIAQAIYTDAVRALDVAKNTLSQETPAFQVINETEWPLSIEGRGRIKYALIFGMIGTSLGFMYILSKKFLSSIKNVG